MPYIAAVSHYLEHELAFDREQQRIPLPAMIHDLGVGSEELDEPSGHQIVVCDQHAERRRSHPSRRGMGGG
jgi:hypothetical protein